MRPVHLVERVLTLDSRDAVAVGDRRARLLCFSDRLTPALRDLLRPHLLAALGEPAGAVAVAVPAGQAATMLTAPYVDLQLRPFAPCQQVGATGNGHG